MYSERGNAGEIRGLGAEFRVFLEYESVRQFTNSKVVLGIICEANEAVGFTRFLGGSHASPVICGSQLNKKCFRYGEFIAASEFREREQLYAKSGEPSRLEPARPIQTMNVLIVGGAGEFGQFLQRDILPHVCDKTVSSVERDTPSEEQRSMLRQARHVVVATPLAGYAQLACELVYRCRDASESKTLWLIPSVQAGVWRALTATLELANNPKLSAVFVHPMYGPNGFRETEREARTFQNVLTAMHEGADNPLRSDIVNISRTFHTTFNIATTTKFDAEEHDRITAYSQGLSYCVAKLMFQRADLAALVQEEMPDLYHSFRANHELITDFLRINSYMPQVIAAFNDAWEQTSKTRLMDILSAFHTADEMLNRGADSPISTKWYEKLRTASHGLQPQKSTKGIP